MTLLDDFMSSDLMRRLGSAKENFNNGRVPNPTGGLLGPAEWNINPVRNVPVLGGFVGAAEGAVLHPFGLLGEAGGQTAKTVAGEMTLLDMITALRWEEKQGRGDSPRAQAAKAALAEGVMHPGRVQDIVRSSPDTGDALAAGAWQLLLDPNNLNPARALGLANEAIKAQRATRTLSNIMEGVQEGDNLATPAARGFRQIMENAASVPNEASQNLPLAPNANDLKRFMLDLGLDAPEKVPDLPLAIAPKKLLPYDQGLVKGAAPTRISEAGLRQIVGDTPLGDTPLGTDKASVLDAFLRGGGGQGFDPTLAESLRTPAVPPEPRNLAQIVGDAPQPEAIDSWMQTPRIIKPFDLAAYEAEKAAGTAGTNLIDAPVKGAKAVAGSGEKYRKFVAAIDPVTGEVPNLDGIDSLGNKNTFWQRQGLTNADVEQFTARARAEGIMGETANAALPVSNVNIPPPRMDGTVKNTLIAIAYDTPGKSESVARRILNSATKLHGEDLLSRAAEIIALDPEKLAAAEKVIPGIGDQLDSLRTGISGKAPDDLFVAIRKAVAAGDPETANSLVDRAREFGATPIQAQEVLNRAASRGSGVSTNAFANVGADTPLSELPKIDPNLLPPDKRSWLDQAGLGSSMNLTPPGLNAAINLGGKALQVPAVAGALGYGGVGAVTGAVTGALADPEDRWGGAIKGGVSGATLGALIGAGAGAFSLSHLSGEAARNTHQYSAAESAAAWQVARAKPGVNPGLKGLRSVWANQTVSTPRQWTQDSFWNKVVLLAKQGKEALKYLRPISDEASRNLSLTGNARRSNLVQNILSNAGYTDDLDLGHTLLHELGKNDLSAKQSAVASAALSFIGGPTNLYGLAAAGAKGYVLPYYAKYIRTSNNALNETFREAGFASEYLDHLMPLALGKFKEMGYDLSHIPVDQLSVQKVTQLYGNTAGAQWARMTKNMVNMSASRVKYLFGDYSSPLTGALGLIEKITKGPLPFSSWAVRAYPVALDIALEHPMVALGIYQYLQFASRQAGKDGRPAYTAGMIPVSTETPGLGIGARGLLGGQKGTAYFDPIGSLSPLGGSLFQPTDETTPDPSLYQAVAQALNRTGLPGFSPVIGALAYILGLDYRAPGSLTRTKGTEDALGLLPRSINLPDLGGGALRLARSKASPLFAATELGQAVGATGDANPTIFDPVARRYGELVLNETHKSVDDPENRAYLYDLAAGTGPLYQQARKDVLLSGFAKNAFSVSSPVAAAVQSEDARKMKVAKAGIPFDYTKLQALAAANIPSDIANAQQDNRAYKQSNPASAAYDVGSRDEALSMLMQDVKDRYTFNGVTHSPTNPAEQAAVMNRLLTEARYGEQFRNLDPVDVPPWKK